MTARAARPVLDPRVADAIGRAQFAADIKDMTGLPKPVKFRGRAQRLRLVRALLERAKKKGAGGAVPQAPWLLRAIRLAAIGLKGWAPPAKSRGSAGRVGPTGPFAGYLTSSETDDVVIRLALLLRLMRRDREALDLLVGRVSSGLPSGQARWWLAHQLELFGEKKAAALLREGAGQAETIQVAIAKGAPSLRYGIVMLTMFDTPVFRASLRSLVESDYPGRIVVVEDGYEPEATCRAFCETLPVTYIKRTRWTGSAAAMNEGIATLAADTDVVAFVHNDVLWPPQWFRAFDTAWADTFADGKVGLINLGYIQFKHKLDTALSELFTRGEYAHLQWILTAMRDVAGLKDDRVQDSQVQGGQWRFGLSRDPWNDWVPDARFMTGRFSVAASFPIRLWRALGGFNEDIPYGFDLELQHYCVSNRQWMLFLNNPPLIHLASSDTRSVDPARRAAVAEVHQTLPAFEAKYGWQVEHFLNIYFSESAFIYQDEIVRAANALRFGDIDFVFDDFDRRLRERVLSNCELTWCRSRATCKYVDHAPAAVGAAGIKTLHGIGDL